MVFSFLSSIFLDDSFVKTNEKTTTPGWLVLGFDCPILPIDNRSGQSQAEAATVFTGVLAFIKTLKDMRQINRINPAAGITNLYFCKQ